jgi:hypothetical protein
MCTAFRGTCRCFRRQSDSEAYIQTYLFKTDATNASHEYGVGESEIIDGLGYFWPLHPWNGQSPPVIAVGDWHCSSVDNIFSGRRPVVQAVAASRGSKFKLTDYPMLLDKATKLEAP